MATAVDERVTEELEALEAILMDDVQILKEEGIPKKVEYIVHPSTGNDTDQQFVCITLEVILTPNYPDKSPQVSLRNPRGLDDDIYERITKQIKEMLENCIGSPVIYELIELVRENLTASNLPSGQCVICLYNFSAGDIFIKTQCYHYFHSNCLACHLDAGQINYKEELDKLPSWQKQQAPAYQPMCPVCRAPVSCDVESLRSAPPPKESVAAPPFCLTAELKALQRNMAALLARQTAKGGTVDCIYIPAPLTITSPEDYVDEADSSSSSPSGSQESSSAPKTTCFGQCRPNAQEPSAPESPKNNGHKNGSKGVYRGFNRRSAPGRRPNMNGNSRGRNNSTHPCPSSNTR